MRSEIQELGRRLLGAHRSLTGRRRSTDADRAAPASNPALLDPRLVDAALEDETTSIAAEGGSRRDLAPGRDCSTGPKRLLDKAHRSAAAERGGDAPEGELLRSLREQLNLLQVQQEQIGRLLERAEGATAAPASARGSATSQRM